MPSAGCHGAASWRRPAVRAAPICAGRARCELGAVAPCKPTHAPHLVPLLLTAVRLGSVFSCAFSALCINNAACNENILPSWVCWLGGLRTGGAPMSASCAGQFHACARMLGICRHGGCPCSAWLQGPAETACVVWMLDSHQGSVSVWAALAPAGERHDGDGMARMLPTFSGAGLHSFLCMG